VRHKNPRFPGQKPQPGAYIPSLDDVLKLVTEKGSSTLGLNIETKITPERQNLFPTPEIFVDLIIEKLKKHKLESRSVIQSFDFRTIKYCKRRYPHILTAALTEEKGVNFQKIAEETRADIISPNWETIGERDVHRLQSKGKRVIPWTANTEDSWNYLLSVGVDGIITDDPEKLIQYLKKRGARE